ncbi:hypothetical protein AB0O28_10295 [Microbispora sp. NPDC088329]|uniref:hypothetical protein n=1 Tax=Microbispora sp. NPDC088329 TaxID=3154869 RepID=UPI0034132441
MGVVEIVNMTDEYAADIVTWRYPAPYDCYDLVGADAGFLRIRETDMSPSWIRGNSSAIACSALTAAYQAASTTNRRLTQVEVYVPN